VSLNVGGGTAVTGTFSGIQWGTGSKFLHVLMNAGNGVVDLGTQQMMSVPYALYAEKANTTNVSVSAVGDTLYLGNGNFILVPGISGANGVQSNLGQHLLPEIQECLDSVISKSPCDGNNAVTYNNYSYDIVEINGQCWFAENLSTDKYSNGDLIPTGLSSTQWQNSNSGAYKVYANNQQNETVYGKLYNGYAVFDSRGICPSGWHVPSDCEWMYLEHSLGISLLNLEKTGFRGTNQGNELKANQGWQGNIVTEITFGFDALPGGWGDANNSYYIGYYTSFWTSTPVNGSYGSGSLWRRQLSYEDARIDRNIDGGYGWAHSIRCIKN
jgi:uncharacterized protein (TIGR02145 family)